MKKIMHFLLVGGLALLAIACERVNEDPAPPENQWTDAVVVTYDLTLCACCGGFFIDIKGQSQRRRFETLPEGSNLDLFKSGVMPLNVRIQWREKMPRCREDLIEVLKIEKR